MPPLTLAELRYMDLLVRGALPISPNHPQWSAEQRRELSAKLMRMVAERVKEPVR